MSDMYNTEMFLKSWFELLMETLYFSSLGEGSERRHKAASLHEMELNLLTLQKYEK